MDEMKNKMLNKKTLLLISLILITMLGITVVSATNNNDTTIQESTHTTEVQTTSTVNEDKIIEDTDNNNPTKAKKDMKKEVTNDNTLKDGQTNIDLDESVSSDVYLAVPLNISYDMETPCVIHVNEESYQCDNLKEGITYTPTTLDTLNIYAVGDAFGTTNTITREVNDVNIDFKIDTSVFEIDYNKNDTISITGKPEIIAGEQTHYITPGTQITINIDNTAKTTTILDDNTFTYSYKITQVKDFNISVSYLNKKSDNYTVDVFLGTIDITLNQEYVFVNETVYGSVYVHRREVPLKGSVTFKDNGTTIKVDGEVVTCKLTNGRADFNFTLKQGKHNLSAVTSNPRIEAIYENFPAILPTINIDENSLQDVYGIGETVSISGVLLFDGEACPVGSEVVLHAGQRSIPSTITSDDGSFTIEFTTQEDDCPTQEVYVSFMNFNSDTVNVKILPDIEITIDDTVYTSTEFVTGNTVTVAAYVTLDGEAVTTDDYVKFYVNDQPYTSDVTNIGDGYYSITLELTSQLYNTEGHVLKVTAQADEMVNATQEFTIQEIPTILTVDDVEGASIGQSMVISAKLTDANQHLLTSQDVTFTFNDETMLTNTTDENGMVYITYTPQSVGEVSVTINYDGNDSMGYAPAVAVTKTFSVNKLNTTITVVPVEAYLGDQTSITVNVADSGNQKVNGGSIQLLIYGSAVIDEATLNDSVEVVDGVATFTYTIPTSWIAADKDVKVIYSGNDIYNSSNNTVKAVIKVKTREANLVLTQENYAKLGEVAILKSSVTSVDGVIDGGYVVYKVNGKVLRDEHNVIVKSLVVDGIATLSYTVNSTVGVNITATYTNSVYDRAKDSMTVTPTVVTPEIVFNDVIMNNETLTIDASILEGDNEPVTDSIRCTIKLNGKTIKNGSKVAQYYTEDGKLNITYTLPAKYRKGNYTVEVVTYKTSRYNQSKANITVKNY